MEVCHEVSLIFRKAPEVDVPVPITIEAGLDVSPN